MKCNAPEVKHFKHRFVDVKCSRCNAVIRQVCSDVYDVLHQQKEYRRMLKSGLCESCLTNEVTITKEVS